MGERDTRYNETIGETGLEDELSFEFDDLELFDKTEDEIFEIDELFDDEILADEFDSELFDSEFVSNINFNIMEMDSIESEDASGDFITSEEIDTKTVQEVRKKLIEAGYGILDNLDFDSLKELIEREENIETLSISDVMKEFDDFIHMQCTKLASSNATLVSSDFETVKVVGSNYIKSPANVNSNYAGLITNLVIQRMQAGIRDTPESLFGFLRGNTGDKLFFDLQSEELLVLYRTIISAAKDMYQSNLLHGMNNEEFRIMNAQYLLAPEILAIKDLLNLAQNKKVAHIKRILINEEGYQFICPFCNKKNNMSEFLSIVVFSSEKGFVKMFIPRAMMCSCEHASILTNEEYSAITKETLESTKKALSAYLNGISKSNTGTSMLRLIPSTDTIRKVAPYLIDSDRMDPIVKDKQVFERRFRNENLINRNVFMDAVQSFYHGLSRFVRSTNENKLTYREVAYYMATLLSKDHYTLKNKAIFSILYYFDESPILRDITRMEKIWDLRNYLKTLRDLKGMEIVTADKFKDLIALYTDISDSHDELDIQKFMGEDLSMGKELLNILKGKSEEIVNKEKRAIIKNQSFIQQLQNVIKPMSYYRIINITNYKLRDFIAYCGSKEMLDIIDILSDHMIITNLAFDFYKYWVELRKINRAAIEKNLNRKTQKGDFISSITSAVTKLVNNCLGNRFINIEKIIANDFELCFNMTAQHLEPLSRLTAEFNACNYYRFCEAINSIPRDLELYLGMECQKQFGQFLKMAKPIAETVCKVDEYEFYLKDFTKEEIEEYRDELEDYSFNMFIPKREQKESLRDYLTRYNELQNSHGLSISNSRSMEQEFEKFFEYYGLISSFGMPFDAEYESFTAATFMISLINIIVLHLQRQDGAEILGMSDHYLSVLNADMKPFDKSKLQFDMWEGVYSVLTGVYTTSVMTPLSKKFEEYSGTFLQSQVTLDFTDYFKNIIDDLSTIYDQDDFTKFSFDQEGVDDSSDARVEMLRYAEASKKLLTVFGGAY